MEWLLRNGWSVERTAAWVYVWRWEGRVKTCEHRFTSVLRAARILQAERGGLNA